MLKQVLVPSISMIWTSDKLHIYSKWINTDQKNSSDHIQSIRDIAY
jgi:hypothetical protein